MNAATSLGAFHCNSPYRRKMTSVFAQITIDSSPLKTFIPGRAGKRNKKKINFSRACPADLSGLIQLTMRWGP